MNVYMVAYDVNKPNESFRKALREAIKNFPNWAILSESCYVVAYAGNAEQAWNFLCNYIDVNDSLFVIQVGPDWKGYGRLEVSEWLVDFLGGKVVATIPMTQQ